jgi:hypothetical protein
MSGQVYSMDDDGEDLKNDPEIDNFAMGLEDEDSDENP